MCELAHVSISLLFANTKSYIRHIATWRVQRRGIRNMKDRVDSFRANADTYARALNIAGNLLFEESKICKDDSEI